MTATAVQQPRASRALAQVVGTSRPLSWVNTAYPFGAAYLLVGGGVDLAFVLGVLYFLVPYNLLMYGVNDVFDYESDVRNPRKGGVEGIVLDRRVHRLTIVLAVLTNVPFVGALVLLGDAASTAVLAVSVFAVVAYSVPVLRFKERALLDSLTSSTHFVSPAVFGVVLAGGDLAAGAAALAAFFVWGAASHAFGAVQDIGADRAAGIASVATWLGARWTVRLALAAYVVSGLLLLTVGLPAALAALLAIPYVASVAPYVGLGDEDCERAHAGWRRFLWLNYVTGFLVTQLLIWMAIGW
ncbi:prenyltransferase [Nocardioides sp. CER19]|uniref:prenyltransferase n=1 Tax=Nocardioides sp. CER19 TaxID=3038538 RepID=UPI002448E14F|nr:prenyltransferase [Nocardioides sp. CER19]MDH2416246.1 prenyltransferase [Nocardioides sp. CER19]